VIVWPSVVAAAVPGVPLVIGPLSGAVGARIGVPVAVGIAVTVPVAVGNWKADSRFPMIARSPPSGGTSKMVWMNFRTDVWSFNVLSILPPAEAGTPLVDHWRRDVVVEAAVLVPGDDHRGVRPDRAVADGRQEADRAHGSRRPWRRDRSEPGVPSLEAALARVLAVCRGRHDERYLRHVRPGH
jgi:hypothetical protein